ncbi:MAG TPA: hypothetical protein VGO35_00910 [Gammaproteobacteria bacterium]|jgi:hypothetical protein|nr:hypothetical protein [Gammaproteobacteria bacterium]
MSPRLLYLLLPAFFMAGPAFAYDDPYALGGSTLLELGRFQTDFDYPDGEHRAHVGRYGIGYNEPVAPDFDLNLHGGYLTLGVDGDPVASLQDYTGRYLGLGARYESSTGDYLNFSVQGDYTWHDVTGSSFVRQSEIVWYEAWVTAGPVLNYGPWRVMGGAYYQNIAGNQTDSGPPASQYRTFSAGSQAGVYLGFALYTDQTGSIAIYGMAGARQGINVVFKREF